MSLVVDGAFVREGVTEGIEELREHLFRAEQALLALERGDPGQRVVALRALHSIKGGARMVLSLG